MTVFIWICTAALATMTLLPLLHSEDWWVRGFDFPRLQLFALAGLLLLAVALRFDAARGADVLQGLVVAACLLYQAWWIVPYSPLFAHEVEAAAAGAPVAVRIMVANVLASNRNDEALLQLVRQHDPHVLVTLESDAWWQARLDTLEPAYPHTLKCPRDNLYGMHVYSKLRLVDAQIQTLVQDGVPSMHALLILPAGRAVQAHFLHPAPPSPTQNDTSSKRDAELIIVGRRVAESELPVIVTGDLNDVAWSRTTRLFRKISGLLDPRVGRGMFNTYHADHAWLRWPLDHLFHSGHFSLKGMWRLPHIGSDHFPLLTELVLAAEPQPRRDALQADAADRRLARAKAAEEQVDRSDVPQPSRD
jgi:endonuclease/exonuclease/phosphatase (EEP) superfamily protein YafD